MTTEILNSQNEEDFEKAVSILKNGGILAFPTETVFGIGADMNNESAVKRIYEIKERNFSKPLSIHVANLDVAKPYIKNVPDDAYILEKNYLPGPLMMIFDKTDLVPNYVTANLHKVGIRVPSNDIFKEIANRFDGIIVATSANKSGAFPACSLEQVLNSLDGLIDGVFANDSILAGLASTVIDLTSQPYRIIRSGFILGEDIAELLGKHILLSDDGDISGKAEQKSKLNIIVVDGERDKVLSKITTLYEKYSKEHEEKVGLLLTDGSEEKTGILKHTKFLGSVNELDHIAESFFACIRAFEKEKMDIVLVEGISREGRGWTVMDRICSYASDIISV